MQNTNFTTVPSARVQSASPTAPPMTAAASCITGDIIIIITMIMHIIIIMHHRDYFFASGQGKTMTPKDANSCSLGGYMTRLTDADVTLLKVTQIFLL